MRTQNFANITMLVGWIAMQGAAFAATCDKQMQIKSGLNVTTVAELYTSEGCSSCPPADKLFSNITPENNKVVPLAFHVDYWDYIGWKDRFGKPEYAERQRASVMRQGSRTVYTPQLMVSGKDAQFWSLNSKFFSAVENSATHKANASIELTAQTNANSVDVKVTTAIDVEKNNVALLLAITENNLVSRITAGENRGETLKHDFVVRQISAPMVTANASIFNQQFTLPPEWKRNDLRIAAFLQNQQTGEILQAVSAPLCGS